MLTINKISQTAIYGATSILYYFITYLPASIYNTIFSSPEFKVACEFYMYAGFCVVFLAIGIESSYYRLNRHRNYHADSVYSSAFLLLIINISILVISLYHYQHFLADWLGYPDNPDYIRYLAWIVAFDTIAILPLAKLRAEHKMKRFLIIKWSDFIVAILFNSMFFILIPKYGYLWPHNQTLIHIYQNFEVSYIFAAGFIACFIKLIMVLPQFLQIKITHAHYRIVMSMFIYSLPVMLIGMASMISDLLDEFVLKAMSGYGYDSSFYMLVIYGLCYKISIFISLAILAIQQIGFPVLFYFNFFTRTKAHYVQAFQYIFICSFSMTVIAIWSNKIFNDFIGDFLEKGIQVIPVLMLINLFIGIYVNLLIWKRLSPSYGAILLIGNAGFMLFLNLKLIPIVGISGLVFSTFLGYACMLMMT